MTIKHFVIAFALATIAAPATAQCYESSIISPSPFMGNNGEIFKLADGSLWEVKYEYEYLYEYQPSVIVCPSKGKLVVDGKTLNVEQVGGRRTSGRAPSRTDSRDEMVESRISGEFTGWSGETIFKLVNGQIWQQSAYAYTYNYKYSPAVMIFSTGGGHEMQVEGMSQRVSVRRLR